MPEIAPDQYQCGACGGIFEKGWSDSEAEAERLSLFGDTVPQNECAIVCDDCYQEWMKSIAG